MRKIKIDYLLLITIIGGAIICFCPIFHNFTGRVVSDNMGCLRLAMKIANYKSDFDSDVIPYYGQMYYAWFFPLFKATNNPYVLYKWIILINAFIRTICCLFIYIIQTKYLKVPKISASLLTLFAVQCFPQNAVTRFSNETPLFFLLTLSIYFILLAKSSAQNMICKMLYIFVCGYGLLVHTRWILFIISAAFAVIVCDYLYYQRIPKIKNVLYCGIVFVLYKVMAKGITYVVYGTFNVHNANLNLATYAQENIISLHGAVVTILSNIYRVCLLTYGLPLIGMLFFAALFFGVIRNRTIDVKMITYNQLFVFLTTGLCLIGSLCGMVVYYGTPISDWLKTGEVNDLLSGLGYERYYIMYVGFFVIGIFSIWDSINYKKIYGIISVVLFVLLFVYVYFEVYGKMGRFQYLFYQGPINLLEHAGIETTFWVVFKIFLLITVLATYSKQWIMLTFIIGINMLNVLQDTNFDKIDIVFEDQYDSAYEFISRIEDNYKSIDLYTDVYQIQYALINKRVLWLTEESIDDAEFIYTNTDVSIGNDLYDIRDYYIIEVDANERFLIKDKYTYDLIKGILD